MTTVTTTTTRQRLDQISLPDKEIEDIFNLHNSLSLSELLNVFQIIIDKISYWLESVHLAVFTLEQNITQDDYNLQDLEPLEDAMMRMEPLIHVLSDLSDIIFNKQGGGATNGIQGVVLNQQMKITKIQSEWSSLQHFKTSVKKQLITSNDQKELISSVDGLLLQIDHVSTIMFDFQEKKHIAAVAVITLPTSPINDESWLQNKDDQGMLEIDNAFEPLLHSIEQIYHRIQQQKVNTILTKRFDKVKEKWEILQLEREELKFEHKEDRWLAVFRRVADQVDVMIDGLDKSIIQCYSLIQQTRDWQASQLPSTPTSTLSKSSRSFQPSTIIIPVDREKFKLVEKSFEAKYKYYTPSIDRMLTMLGNGIAARVSRDNTTSLRHEAMITRWTLLKQVMDELRMRDLIETERIIISFSTNSNSSASSSTSPSPSGWKGGIRYRTPEPNTNSREMAARSITPNSGGGSAYSTHSGGRNSSIGRSSPATISRNHDYYYQQSLLRGSISDSSSVSSSPPSRNSNYNTKQTKTPKPTRNTSIKTIINEDFYDQDERYYGIDLMKLNNNTNTNRPLSSTKNYARSSSTLERKRSTSVEKPSIRSKTPNPPPTNRNNTIRAKSSLGDFNHIRSVTPSLIPRPKTPKDDIPMIPRPKSQLRNINSSHNKPPPVPPIPKYVISHENDYAAYRDPSILLKKKQSMPILRNNTTMEISFNEDCIYRPDHKDPLDIEVAQIVNASPISIKCQKSQPGRYYFGNELSMSSMGGKKMYTCKLMTYADRRGGQFKNNKVLIRVGGGWQDLEFFLLEHSSLMASDVVVRSFGSERPPSRGGSWRN